MLGITSEGCQLGTISMARIGFSLNNFFFSMDSFRWLHNKSWSRRSLGTPVIRR